MYVCMWYQFQCISVLNDSRKGKKKPLNPTQLTTSMFSLEGELIFFLALLPYCTFTLRSFSPTDTKFTTCADDGTVRVFDFMRCHEERVLRGK